MSVALVIIERLMANFPPPRNTLEDPMAGIFLLVLSTHQHQKRDDSHISHLALKCLKHTALSRKNCKPGLFNNQVWELPSYGPNFAVLVEHFTV